MKVLIVDDEDLIRNIIKGIWMTKSKIVIRTQYKLSLNNPDRLKTFKDKDQKYVDGIIDYFSDDSKRALNLIDYFTGKINKHEDMLNVIYGDIDVFEIIVNRGGENITLKGSIDYND